MEILNTYYSFAIIHFKCKVINPHSLEIINLLSLPIIILLIANLLILFDDFKGWNSHFQFILAFNLYISYCLFLLKELVQEK